MLELQSEKAFFECLPRTFKKLVTVSATSPSVIKASKEQHMSLKRVPYIHYLLCFCKDIASVRALIDLGSEVNAMSPAYVSKLGLKVYHTNIVAQNVDDSTLETFRIVLTSFQVEDKLEKIRFFQETFLLADINVEEVLGILFLTFSNADIQFVKKELTWRSYTNAKTLLTTKWVELINNKEFAKAVLDEKFKTFVVYVASLNLTPGIYSDKAAQLASLLTKDVRILDKYSDFADVFLEEKALMLPEYSKCNEHTINLEDGKQPLYGPIYSLGPVELETLKTYIKTHLKTGFIWLSKSPVGTPILLNKKPDNSLRLCVNYWGLNKLTMKNWYPLPLINELLDRLGQAKRFTHLDLISAYHQMRVKEGDE